MKQFGIALFVLLSNLGWGQVNLVPNPSFEDYNSCPNFLAELGKCYNWYNPNLSSPDYYNSCCIQPYPNGADVPRNWPGYQFASTGNAYSGIACFADSLNQREYIAVRLADTLNQGKSYFVEFYVSLANISMYGIDNLGMHFSTDSIFGSFPSQVLNVTPQIRNTEFDFLTDTLNWMRVSGIYVAGGGEKFIAIGNFYDLLQTNFVLLDSNITRGSYYYIDDVYVGEYIPETSLNFVLYPNPSNGMVELDYRLGEDSSAVFVLYNSIGQLVYKEELLTQTGTANFDFSFSATGVYYWQVFTHENKLLGKNKLMIIKS